MNAAVEDLAEKINATSKELPPGQSEAEFAGLTLEPSTKVRPPRVAESPVHLECRVRQIMSIGDGPIAANLVIGEVLLIHIDDAVLDDHGTSIPASCGRSPDWGATTTAGAPISSRWNGREPAEHSRRHGTGDIAALSCRSRLRPAIRSRRTEPPPTPSRRGLFFVGAGSARRSNRRGAASESRRGPFFLGAGSARRSDRRTEPPPTPSRRGLFFVGAGSARRSTRRTEPPPTPSRRGLFFVGAGSARRSHRRTEPPPTPSRRGLFF